MGSLLRSRFQYRHATLLSTQVDPTQSGMPTRGEERCVTTLKTAARETNGCGKGKNLTRFQVPREGLFDMVAQEPGS